MIGFLVRVGERNGWICDVFWAGGESLMVIGQNSGEWRAESRSREAQ